MYFGTRSFWLKMHVPKKELRIRIEHFFGKTNRIIDDRKEAIKILLNVTSTIQEEMVKRIKTETTCGMLMKLYYIFDEVHSMYMHEKEVRDQLVKNGVDNGNVIDQFISNAHIQRNIIDASNIWIENSILLQHDVDWSSKNVKNEFKMDSQLLIDLFLYGMASWYISLLNLSKNVGEENTYSGIEISLNKDVPVEIVKYHPYIFFNTALVGNQSDLNDNKFTVEADQSDFGKGFFEEYNVRFLPFLAALKSIQEDRYMLRGDEKSLTVISKQRLIDYVESCTSPKIEGEKFYEAFVLDKQKIENQLRPKEPIIWIVGTNKYRHEIRPFIGFDDGNVLLSYGALEQAKQLWVSYFNNGGNYYTNPQKADTLKRAMEKRNDELSDVLLEKLREILHKHYDADVDLKDVDYDRIFGKKEDNYGDYDIVYFDKTKRELFLIESKYFSDSLNATGMVNDYNKMFQENGYYYHCRKRYDLVLNEPEKLKAFLNFTGELKVHMLFVSSKPIEMELQDDEKVVTFLSLNIFEKYVTGKLISGEDDSIINTALEI